MKKKNLLLGVLSLALMATTALALGSCDGFKLNRCTIAGHNYEDRICVNCGEKMPSEGLEFTKIEGKKEYAVTGLGSCTDTDIIIPAEHEGLPVTSIGSDAFAYCYSLTSVVIPDSVTSIGNFAFYYCSSLTSVEIPDSVTSIGDYAFSACNSLQYNEYDNGYYLGNENNKYVVLVKAKDKSITNCNIHQNTKVVYSSAFDGCTSLTSVEIPDSVTSIGEGAFADCSSLTSVVIPDSVTSIGGSSFSNCDSLTSIVIPASVTSIGGGAFSSCDSLTSVVIGDGVTSIGNYAFQNCTSLTSVTFKKPNGWFVTKSSTATSGTDISSADLSDTATAASYLKDSSCYWKRSE